MKADEIQSRFVLDDSAVMPGLVFCMDGQINPSKPRMKPCAPDDIPDIEDLAILRNSHPTDSRHAFHSHSGKVCRSLADQRTTLRENGRPLKHFSPSSEKKISSS